MGMRRFVLLGLIFASLVCYAAADDGFGDDDAYDDWEDEEVEDIPRKTQQQQKPKAASSKSKADDDDEWYDEDDVEDEPIPQSRPRGGGSGGGARPPSAPIVHKFPDGSVESFVDWDPSLAGKSGGAGGAAPATGRVAGGGGGRRAPPRAAEEEDEWDDEDDWEYEDDEQIGAGQAAMSGGAAGGRAGRASGGGGGSAAFAGLSFMQIAQKANEAANTGDFATALVGFKLLLEDAPDGDLPLLYSNVGTCLINLKREPEAKEWFEKAIAIDPKLVSAHLSLGRIYQIVQDLPKAVKSFNTALPLITDPQQKAAVEEAIEKISGML